MAARSEDRLAAYPVGIIRCQEHGDPTDVLWLADAAERGGPQARLVKLTFERTHSVRTFRLNEARIDTIHPDLAWTKLFREGDGDGVHCPFRRGVDGAVSR